MKNAVIFRSIGWGARSLGGPDRRISMRLSLLLAAAAALTTTMAQADPRYTTIDVSTKVVAGDLVSTVTIVQVGDDALARFSVHRLSSRSPARPIVLLPPITNGFEFYEVPEEGDPGRSFAAQLVRAGMDVWGYSTRAQGLAPGACGAGGSGCPAAAGWGLQAIVDDVGFIRQMIAAAYPPRRRSPRPIVGGVSLGSIAAAAVINAAPDDYAGAFLIEGSDYSADPQVRQINQAFCAALEGQLGAGVTLDDQTLPGFRLMAQLAAAAPTDPSPLPGFAGLSNRQALVAALSNTQLSPFQPLPGFFVAGGDVGTGRFSHADEKLVQAVLAALPTYSPLRLLRDIDCGLAGERAFTGRLHGFRAPLFVEQDGHGFGASVDDMAALTSASSIVRVTHPDYGHYDAVFAPTRAWDRTLLGLWLRSVFFLDAFH
jgi:pimeloyl-ACP methyl ester carboxylesterase